MAKEKVGHNTYVSHGDGSPKNNKQTYKKSGLLGDLTKTGGRYDSKKGEFKK